MAKRWYKSSVAAVLAVALLIPAAAVSAATETEAGLSYAATKKAAEEKAAVLTGGYGVYSVQYALFDQGRIVVSGQAGINDEQGQIPLTNETVYGIGSVSKVYTAAAVMKLVDEGKLELDKPLINYLPRFTMKDSRYKQITPRMLLNHSSGLNGSTLSNSFLFGDNDSYAYDRFLESLAQQELKAAPGAYSVYSNDSFTLAELLVEEVSGMSFTDFIHHYFTEPMGLSRTQTSGDGLEEGKMAALYTPMRQSQMPLEIVNVIGTGGIYSTAEELALFGGLFAGYEGDILSEKSVSLMGEEEYKRGLWPEDGADMISYGLGWDAVQLFPFDDYEIKALSKGGDTLFYHAQLIVLPEQGMAAAVLSSGGASTYNGVFAADLLLQALKERGDIKELPSPKSHGEPEAAKLPQEQLEFSGFYGATSQVYKVELTPEGKLLLSSASLPAAGTVEYIYTKSGDYISADGTMKARFVEEENGEVYLWTSDYMELPGIGQISLTHYALEKLGPNEISEATAAAWGERDGKSYYVVNEKYTSALYLQGPGMALQLLDEIPGYIMDQKITGPNSSRSDIGIPGMNGRDHSPLQFYTENGNEYVTAQGAIYMNEDAVSDIYAGKKSKATILENGFARWFTVPEAAAGKSLTVNLPAQSSFAVYDEAGVCVYFSQVDDERAVELPAGGSLVFVGAPGALFQLSIR
ncbi:serine hydrolase domain-containing protein [Paenibacillus sp. CAU 1782]